MILKTNETAANSILSVNSELGDYPVTNILDTRLSRVFRTDSNTTAEIVFNAGSAINVNSVNIAAHNISESVTTLKFQGNTSDSWGAPAFEIDLDWNENIIVADFENENYQYWRVQIIDPSNSDGYIEIGRTGLYDGYITPGIKVLVTHDRKSSTEKTKSIGGQTYSDTGYFYSVVSVSFPKITESQYYEIVAVFESVDIGYPFFVTFDKGGAILQTLYVTYNFDGLKLNPLGNRNLYNTGMDFIEEV